MAAGFRAVAAQTGSPCASWLHGHCGIQCPIKSPLRSDGGLILHPVLCGRAPFVVGSSGGPCLGALGGLSHFFAQPLFALRLKRANLFQLCLNIFALLDQLRAVILEHLQKLGELRSLIARVVVHVDQLADFG